MTNKKTVAAPSAGETAHIAQEMYKKNLELAERNKTLSLLRKIDEIALSSVTKTDAVATAITRALAEDADYTLAAIYIREKAKKCLKPIAVATKGSTASEIEQNLLRSHISLTAASNPAVQAVKQHRIESVHKLFEVLKPNLPIEEAEEIQKALGVKCFMVCPLASRDEILGVIIIGLQQNSGQLSDFQTSLLERLTGAIGVAIDNTLLYEGIQDATKRLKTANRHLKELDQAKDEFISMASHQLRTPLTTVKGYISMMLDGDVGKVGKDQKEFLEYAYGGAQRMVHLISDLLNISRMEAGRFMIERTAVDLQKMAQEETTQLQTHAKEKGLKLEFIPPAKPLPTLNVDEDKTRQVVMNFIDNALYYTKKGRITVTLERAGDQAVLKVQDTGIGVPKADQAKLFKKFFRAENAHKVRPDGTGLGLYLAKRVIADQGGTLIFESAEGKGSTFGFKLPLDQNKQ